MRTRLAQQRTAAGGWILFLCFPARRGGPSPIIAAAAVALGLASAGCTPIPIPDAALLRPQPAPRCDARANNKAQQQSGAPADAADPSSLAKLDYERQCYRHAELIARNRLQKLQASVQQTLKAIRRSEGYSP